MSNPYTPEEPISSIATALAPAALGIVRTSGKNCIELVSKLFSSPDKLLSATGNTIVYGWIVAPENQIANLDRGLPTEQEISSAGGQAGGGLVDEVMIAVYRSPKSFTGEDMVEIFCHGGPAVVTAIQNLLLKNGFRQAERGEYTFRAYINGKTDLTKAEAVREIIDSHTDTARGRAAGRLAGSLYEEIDEIKKLIIDTLAAIEVEIEYPEDEETIADSFDATDIEKARDRLQSLVDSWKGEKLYQDGARVVLCGRTNAGKSSLFNAILKEDRAIVSDIAGTTRDWLESWASFDGIPVRLFDTAGLRETSDVIEAQGVELTKSLSTDADVVLYLVDASGAAPDCLCGETDINPNITTPASIGTPIGWLHEDDIDFLKNCKEPVLLVWNKCDATTGESQSSDGVATSSGKSATEESQSAVGVAMSRDITNEIPALRGSVRISAKKGTGLDELYRQVKSILTSGFSTERTQAGLGSERQKEAVSEALESVKHALVSASDNYTLDAVVQDLEDALESLGTVTGDVTPDDVLGSIFANFCVGK